MRTIGLAFGLLMTTLIPAHLMAQGNEDKPFPPHKVIGNLYYVGTDTHSSFLVTTPAGNILIDSTYESNVPWIRDSVEKLGFKFTDIKILLTSHAHVDHCEGDALVKQMTGATVMIMDATFRLHRRFGREEKRIRSTGSCTTWIESRWETKF